MHFVLHFDFDLVTPQDQTNWQVIFYCACMGYMAVIGRWPDYNIVALVHGIAIQMIHTYIINANIRAQVGATADHSASASQDLSEPPTMSNPTLHE